MILKDKNCALTVGAIIFGLIGLMHLLRILMNWQVQIAGNDVPHLASYVALVLSWFLSAWFIYLRRQ